MSMLREKLSLTLTLLLAFFALSLSPLFGKVEVISEENARVQAALSIIENVAFETPLLEEWADACLGDSILLWDPGNAEQAPLPLVYDFDVLVNNEPKGRVSVPATSWLGTTRLALNLSTRTYSIEASLAEASNRIYEIYPHADILSIVPVVYQYPKVAAMIDVYMPPLQGEYRIFMELPTLRILKSGVEEALSNLSKTWFMSLTTNELPPGRSEIYSVYYNLPEEVKLANEISYLQEWEIVDHTMETLCADTDIDYYLAEPINGDLWPVISDLLVELGWYQDEQKILPTHKCKLIKQEKGDWCARAVAQMIMYYHYGMLFHTQTQIDSFMDAYGWNYKWEYAMKKYYTKWLSLTASKFDTNITTANMNNPTKQEAGWNVIKQQIDDGYPFCDGVPVHARMGMAYKIHGHNQFVTLYDVGIYDPDMYNGGVRWETGWKEAMTGFGQVAPRYFLFIARYNP